MADTFRLSDQDKLDVAELIVYLRRIPSRHRHLLAALDFEFYTALVRLETSAKALADKVEESALHH